MSGKQCRLFKSTTSEMQVYVRGMPFTLDIELLASRSAKIAALLKENSIEDVSYFFREIPTGADTFELVARFCHGFEVQLSTENSVPLICLAHYLEMTEEHSKNNLLNKAANFFEHTVLPSWNETIKAFRVAEKFLMQTKHLGLFNAILESLVEKALLDPCLLGEPIKVSTNCDGSEDGDDIYRPNARRRLFCHDWKEDLTTLSPQLYEPTIQAMNQHGIPAEYIAVSICQYAKKWLFHCESDGDCMSIYGRSSQRDVIETLERLLPHGKGLLPCTLLFEMLRYAIVLEANAECRNGFETRIGRQLDQAAVGDLLIPSQGYAKEVQYDIECVRRILKHFYGNYKFSDLSGLVVVAELIEQFLAEVASDIDLKVGTFVSLAEMSMAASLGIQRSSDGIYRAIDIYLDKHKYLTQMEREEVCRVLDCQKMSPEACEHAAKNERLPMRVVIQVLFVAQLKLRDAVTKEMQGLDEKLRNEEGEEEEDEAKVSCKEEEVRMEMENMSNRVMELEKECYIMKRVIESNCSKHPSGRKGKRISMWTEVKRKFGCMSSIHDCNCQVKKKKVHPKY